MGNNITGDVLPGAQVEILRYAVSEQGHQFPPATIGKVIAGPGSFASFTITGYLVEVQRENPCTRVVEFNTLQLRRSDFVPTGVALP